MGDDDFSFEFEAQLDRKDRLLPAAAGPGSDQRALAVAPPPDLTGQQPGSYRKNFKKTVCTYWLRGMCMKGDACGFLHQYDVDRMPICRNLLRHGECRDLDCPYKHDTEEIKECNMYRLGFCIYGPQCRFRHRPLPGPPPAIEVVEAAKPKDFRDINRVVNAVNPGVVEERDRYRGPKRFGDGPADSGPGPDVKRPRALPWSGGIRPPAPAAPLALPAPPAAPPAAGAPAPARPPGGGPPPPGRPPALPGPAPPPGGPPVPPPRPPSDPPPAKPGVPPPRPPPGPPPPRPGPQPPPNPPPLQQQGGSGTNKDGAGLPGGGGLQGMGMPSVMGPGAMPGMMGGMPGMMVGGMGGPGMMPGFLPGQGMGMGMMPGAFMSGPPPGGMMMMGGQGQGGNGGAAGGMPPAKGVGAGPGMRMGTQF